LKESLAKNFYAKLRFAEEFRQLLAKFMPLEKRKLFVVKFLCFFLFKERSEAGLGEAQGLKAYGVLLFGIFK